MTYHDHDHDADLAAVRATTAARTATGEDSLARTWERIAAARPVAASPHRARWLVPVGAAATVTAVALGSVALLGGGDGTVQPATTEFPPITDPTEIAFPLDVYNFTSASYAVYTEAMVHLTTECLRRYGAGPEWEVEPENLPDVDARYHWRYGVFDLDAAKEWGYRPPPDGPAFQVPYSMFPHYKLDESILWLSLSRLSSSGQSALPPDDELFLTLGRGVPRFADRPLPEDIDGNRLPEDGCNGEAIRRLSGGLPYPEFEVEDFEIRAAADERVRAADAAWSDCMRRAGYEYKSYRDADERAWEGYGEADADTDRVNDDEIRRPPPAEIADAVANVGCKIETNLVGVLVGVTSELQDEFIQANWDELQEVEFWLDTVHRNAQQVLAKRAGSS